MKKSGPAAERGGAAGPDERRCPVGSQSEGRVHGRGGRRQVGNAREQRRLHYSTYIPPEVYGRLKAAGVACGIAGVGTAGAAVLSSFGAGELALAAVRGLPSIEPHLREKWLRLPMVVSRSLKKEIDDASATSGLQKMFVGGVVLVSVAESFVPRIAAARGDNVGREEERDGRREE